MAWRHLVADFLAQHLVVISVVDGIVRGHGVITNEKRSAPLSILTILL